MQPLLLISYGSPDQQEDVVPFLNNLFVGKNVPAERIAMAAQKYVRYAATTGHYSPLNSECRKLIGGIRREWHLHHNEPPPVNTEADAEFRTGHSLPPDPVRVYWGNLFWHPLLTETVAEMARDGVTSAACFATSAFDSPTGNQRYADALVTARQAVGETAPILEKLPLPFNHPLFLEAQTDRLLETLAWHHLEQTAADAHGKMCHSDTVILFSAHSIPLADAARCHYVEQLQWTCRKVIEKSGTSLPWELVYQSRSGPAEHWLGPDIKERLRALAGQCSSVIVSPIGFFCENMETEYDLDVEVGECCAELGLSFFRSTAVGATPKICRMIVELVERQHLANCENCNTMEHV